MEIAALCTLSTGLISIKYALNFGVKISRVIGLRPDAVKCTTQISGYIDIRKFCDENAIEFTYVDDYTLKSEIPDALLTDIDLLWVCGWQRLIPKTFLDLPRHGAVGAHGSCDGITKGRGRSPQNWAILVGAKTFEISVFRLTNGVDDGAVISTEIFDIDTFDNIQTSYIKSAISVAKCITKIYRDPSILDGALKQSGTSEYLPKRIPSDGNIDWNMSVKDIYNQVRALTDPYPNARTFLGEVELFIKRALPIVSKSEFEPGFIVDKFSDKGLLVAAKDGYLLIEDYESNTENNGLCSGVVFRSVDMSFTVIGIMERFKKDFPGKTLNSTLRQFWTRVGAGI
jgi:UDP-4-amino-4-deoxy-L-arabinose formyltransferase/UDP-glucuronic acid dehydrogenase (UDP-4-keto-hexauronic acid decarboxylating)